MATITARAGNRKRSIKVRRPPWKNMYENYFTGSSDLFYPMISGKWVNMVKENPIVWENTCAGRMSYALNHSGFILPQNNYGAFKGDNDSYYYWFRVKELLGYLKNKFGNGDIEYYPPLIDFKSHLPIEEILENRKNNVKDKLINQINNKKGIIVFEASGWKNASGHFTLWDGKNLLFAPGHNNPNNYEYYFWLISGNQDRFVQTSKIIFWELK
ncbi:T6SS effector amidase Tae4 family protein [Avibacterium avium]|uniref:T6SS effector amidase Tae4 family protein n=1 Tax=Avibacterium avium TaxID=751 RepID=UPI003BF84D84